MTTNELSEPVKSNYFTKIMFYKFLYPSLLSSIGLSLGNVVDSLVVGTKMGASAIAAINIVLPVYMIFNVLDLGMAIGGSIRYARLLGEGKSKQAVVSFNQMFFSTILISVVIALAGRLFLSQILSILGTSPSDGSLYSFAYDYAGILFLASPLFFISMVLYYYVRNDDAQRLATIGFLAGNLIDFILNFVFVIGLDMGVKGAIYATVIGKTVSVLVYLSYILMKYSILRIDFVKFEIGEVWKNFKAGFASSSQYLFQFITLILMNNLLLRLGHKNGLGDGALAVFAVTINVSFLILALYDGISSTLQPLCATFFGEMNRKAKIAVLKLSIAWGLALGLLAILFITYFAGEICALFGLDSNLINEIGIYALRMYGTSTIIAGFSIMMGAYYQSVEKESLVFLINFMRTFAVYISIALILGFTANVVHFWWLFLLTELVSLLIWVTYAKVSQKRKLEINLDESRILHKTIVNKTDDLGALIGEVEEFCEKFSASMTQQYYVNLTVEEICQAIALNGFVGKPDEYIEITLIAEEDSSFRLHIRDSATTFNPFDMKTQRVENTESDDDKMDSIGILMVKSKAKEFFYRRYQGFNTLMVRV